MAEQAGILRSSSSRERKGSVENSEWSLSRFLACSSLPCSTNLVTASQYSACCSGSSLAWLRTDLALSSQPVKWRLVQWRRWGSTRPPGVVSR